MLDKMWSLYVYFIMLLYFLWESCLATTALVSDGNGIIIQYSRELLLSLQHHSVSSNQAELKSEPRIKTDNRRQNRIGKSTRKRGGKGGVREKLKRLAGVGLCPPLPSVILANVRSLRNKLDELQANCKLQWAYKEASLICITESWLDRSIPDTVLGWFWSANSSR